MRNLVLAGDIGGTKTLLALAEPGRHGRPAFVYEQRYLDRDFATFGALVEHFHAEVRHALKEPLVIARCCLGIAGPVEGRRVKVTNFPWEIDADAVSRLLDGAGVALVNDFHAAAAGIEALGPGDLVELQSGEPRADAPRLVIGAGTGLGVALLVPEGEGSRIVAGEGGHVGFAPADEEQARLWRFLHARKSRVTVEDVVSGGGLEAIYAFLASEAGHEAAAPDAAAITGAAAAGDPLAARAVDLFLWCYGAVAGDYALATLPRGGVFLAGGIAPRLLDRLHSGTFLSAFRAKGVHAYLMDRIPVHIVVNERLGLVGAALIAQHARGLPG